MALNISMETYLSLVTVLIMCIPGIVFLVQIWHKRKVERRSNLAVNPTRDERMGPSLLFYDAIFHLPSAPQHPSFPQEEQRLAFDRLHSRFRPDGNCVELVSVHDIKPLESGLLTCS